jgi:predicted RNA-binding protein with PIN domain
MERYDQLGRRARLLIDGYNLLHASPFLGRDRSPGWLERARQRLLTFVSDRLLSGERGRTVVVFDAPRGPLSESRVGTAPGVEALFSVGFPEADDLLERWIRLHPTPKRLLVVSADRRLGVAAERRRATWVASGEWYGSRRGLSVCSGPETISAMPGDSMRVGESTPSLSLTGWLAYFGLGSVVARGGSEPTQAAGPGPVDAPHSAEVRPSRSSTPDDGEDRRPAAPPNKALPAVRTASSSVERPVAAAGQSSAAVRANHCESRSQKSPSVRRRSGPDDRRRARRPLSDDDLVP